MKILLIAYACEPGKGSEPGVGWNWALHLSKYENVTVITRTNNKAIIQDELHNINNSNLAFLYYDIPILSKIKNYIPFGVQIYFLLWEYLVAKKVGIKSNYDILQRITFVSAVTFLRLYETKKPYIMSFITGGEKSPSLIYENYSYYHKIQEYLRSIYNSAYQYLLITRNAYNRSRIVLSVNEDTKNHISKSGYIGRSEVIPAIGIDAFELSAKKNKDNFNIVYAGRLIYWKNVDILLQAMLGISIDKIILNIYGDGAQKTRLKKIVSKNDLNSSIAFHGNLPREKLIATLGNSHLFVFASSHDSGGMIILEAIAIGLPVLFLDTGGPKEIFKNINYPLKINPDQSYENIVKSFRDKIEWAYQNYDMVYNSFLDVRVRILERYGWDNKAKKMIELYREILSENTPST